MNSAPILELNNKPLIGMIHLPTLDCYLSPSFDFDDSFRISIADTLTLKQAGFNTILIENFHDVPFPKSRINDAKFLLMSKIVDKIIKTVPDMIIGVNVLRNACTQALTIATINKASFIRCNIWEGAYVTDQGIIEAASSQVMREKQILRSTVKILADIGVKHASPLGQFSLEEAAQNAMKRGRADAVILSGKETGKMISIDKLRNFVQKTHIKPLLGSGITVENLSSVFPYISGGIVGSSLKYDSTNLHSPIDLEKASNLMNYWNKLSKKEE
ncbi:MAG: BtpA/SgcQ family protein [Candidatus Heimdallarchaeota archaeon]|nr:BtpA/SgcQ family protein [Candidatus Heimdallarchaeota archaeon]